MDTLKGYCLYIYIYKHIYSLRKGNYNNQESWLEKGIMKVHIQCFL